MRFMAMISMIFALSACGGRDNGGDGDGTGGGSDNNMGPSLCTADDVAMQLFGCTSVGDLRGNAGDDIARVEDCDPLNNTKGSDDDLDGVVDEGCSCNADESQSCFPGPIDQPALERCQLGVQICDPKAAEFGAWAACTGWKECEITEQVFVYGEEENVRPVDIVMAVDQSYSMDAEIASVKTNVNGFASTLANSGIDFRFVLVAKRGLGEFDLCIPPPLGGPNCANSPRFMHIDQEVDSWDALTQMQTYMNDIELFMRPNSLRVFMVVTDDNAGGYNNEVLGQEFHDFVVNRPGNADYLFHGIVGDGMCATMATTGTEYQLLATLTGGIIESICTQNWSATFQNFASNIISKTLLYELQEVPFDVAEVAFLDPTSGAEIVQPRGTVWDYNPDSNAVVLFDGFTPSNGTKIIVRYRKIIDQG